MHVDSTRIVLPARFNPVSWGFIIGIVRNRNSAHGIVTALAVLRLVIAGSVRVNIHDDVFIEFN